MGSSSHLPPSHAVKHWTDDHGPNAAKNIACDDACTEEATSSLHRIVADCSVLLSCLSVFYAMIRHFLFTSRHSSPPKAAGKVRRRVRFEGVPSTRDRRHLRRLWQCILLLTMMLMMFGQGRPSFSFSKS